MLLVKYYTRIVGFLQSMNGRKIENPTRKTCSEYFKVMNGKNEKARRETLHEKLRHRYMFCLQETMNGNQNN